MHGISLTDGLRRASILRASCKALGDPVASTVDGAKIAAVRARWMANGVTGKTANNRLGYLKAVYNELHKLDVIDYPCPFFPYQARPASGTPLGLPDQTANNRTARCT
ncbi:phage integrase [Stutzerimonas marianensis]